MDNHFALAQLCQKVLWAFEGFHLDKNAADLCERVGVGTGASRDAKRAPELLGSPVDLRLRAAVESLDDVDLSGDSFDRRFAEVASARVIRVFQIDQPSPSFDRVDRLFGRQPTANGLLEEEADEFPLISQDLLADDGGFAGHEQRLSALDVFVVRQENGGEARLGAAAGDFEWWNPTIEGSGAVQVEIHPDPGAPCASHHVRYYRSGRGLREGSDTSEGWLLTGKERLSLRNKLAPWN